MRSEQEIRERLAAYEGDERYCNEQLQRVDLFVSQERYLKGRRQRGRDLAAELRWVLNEAQDDE